MIIQVFFLFFSYLILKLIYFNKDAEEQRPFYNLILSETTSKPSLSEICFRSIFFLLFLIPSVIQIVFGSKNIKNCPSNSFIPYWLIIFGLILLFIGIFACIDLNIYIMVFNCVICIWFIIWIVIGSFLMHNIYFSRNVIK